MAPKFWGHQIKGKQTYFASLAVKLPYVKTTPGNLKKVLLDTLGDGIMM
jgi:hypothetical protein